MGTSQREVTNWLFGTNKLKVKLIQIEITDDKSLLEACDILHDASFDLSTLKYDEDMGTLNALFKREFLEDPSLIKRERRFLLFEKISFPLIQSMLSLAGVQDFKIKDKSRIGTYMFLECEIVECSYQFVFCEDMKFTLRFEDNPKGYLSDEKLLDAKGTYYTFRNPFSRKI